MERKNASCEVLVSDILDIAMVPLLFTLNVNGEIEKEQLALYRKERFISAQKGKIELVCSRGDEKKFVLDEGDCVYCKCDVPCKRMSNIGNRKAVVMWVIRAPLV